METRPTEPTTLRHTRGKTAGRHPVPSIPAARFPHVPTNVVRKQPLDIFLTALADGLSARHRGHGKTARNHVENNLPTQHTRVAATPEAREKTARPHGKEKITLQA
mmetsp:Transcript_37382/g.106973  ORF Transcript_37382/g.106973 Transcript_37382/m.106973 type:complete len:106 (-) Transcript_37382:895-1212(-)